MDIGIGLPSSVTGVGGRDVVEWARRADDTPLSALAVGEQLLGPDYEPLCALAAAAAVTERIRLFTAVVLAPLRTNTALFAKQAATIHHLSAGRLVLGVGVGSKRDEFAVSGVDMRTRGRALDRQLELMKRIWSGDDLGVGRAIGPVAGERPQLLTGGTADAVFDRAARYGDGWVMGGGGPGELIQATAKLDQAWRAAGRSDAPRKVASAYFGLGPRARQVAHGYLTEYYRHLGSDMATMIAESTPTDAEAIQALVAAFDDAGCDELLMFPTSTDPGQVDLLVAAIGTRR